jgi:uncharacterized phage protein gp47/JayE
MQMQWMDGPERVRYRKCFPLARGTGTFDVVITSNLPAETATKDLRDAVYAHIDDLRALPGGEMAVISATHKWTDINIQVVGSVDTDLLTSNTRSLVNSLEPAKTLYRSQLEAIAIGLGADSANVVFPAADLVPLKDVVNGVYEMIRPGTVTVEVL